MQQRTKITEIHMADAYYTEKKLIGETGTIIDLELSRVGQEWLNAYIKLDSEKLREEYGELVVFYAVKLELV